MDSQEQATDKWVLMRALVLGISRASSNKVLNATDNGNNIQCLAHIVMPAWRNNPGKKNVSFNCTEKKISRSFLGRFVVVFPTELLASGTNYQYRTYPADPESKKS